MKRRFLSILATASILASMMLTQAGIQLSAEGSETMIRDFESMTDEEAAALFADPNGTTYAGADTVKTVTISPDGGENGSKALSMYTEMHYTHSETKFSHFIPAEGDGLRLWAWLRTTSTLQYNKTQPIMEISVIQGDEQHSLVKVDHDFNVVDGTAVSKNENEVEIIGNRYTRAGATYEIKWADTNFDLTKPVTLYITSHAANSADMNGTAAHFQKTWITVDNIRYFDGETETSKVDEIAQGITSIQTPPVNAVSLTLPEVPGGHTISIKSSSHPEVVALDGTIVPPAEAVDVELVLTVSDRAGNTADTAPITVTIPAKYEKDPLLIEDFEFMTTDEEAAALFTDPKGTTYAGADTVKTVTISPDGGENGSKALSLYTEMHYTYSETKFSHFIPAEGDGLRLWAWLRTTSTLQYNKTQPIMEISVVQGDEKHTLVKVDHDFDVVDGTAVSKNENEVEIIGNRYTRAGATYEIKWVDTTFDLTKPVTLYITSHAANSADMNGTAGHFQKTWITVDNIRYFEDETETSKVNEIAQGITSIQAPQANEVTLTLPTVPGGHTISIKSSSHPEVVALDGTIVPPAEDIDVELVLMVSDRAGNTADTAPITVTIPAKILSYPLLIQDFEDLTTEDLGDTITIKPGPNAHYGDQKNDMTVSANGGVDDSRALRIYFAGHNYDGYSDVTYKNIPVDHDGMALWLSAKIGESGSLTVAIIQDDEVKGYFQLEDGRLLNDLRYLGQVVSKASVCWSDIGVKGGTVDLRIRFSRPIQVAAGPNGWVTVDDIYYFDEEITDTRTAQQVADSLTSLPVQKKDAVELVFPSMPTGFRLSIVSSDNPAVVDTDGNVLPPKQDTTVTLVLQVRKGADETANTAPIQVLIPARSVDPLVDLGKEDFSSYRTDAKIQAFWDSMKVTEGVQKVTLSANNGSRNSASMHIYQQIYYSWSKNSLTKNIGMQKDGIALRLNLQSASLGDVTVKIGIMQDGQFKGYLIDDTLTPGVYYPVLWWEDTTLVKPEDGGGDVTFCIQTSSDKADASVAMQYADTVHMYLDDIQFISKAGSATAQSVADGIQSIEQPKADDEEITWPEIPEGFWIEIEETSEPSIISNIGKISSLRQEATVELRFRVIAPGGESALTKTLSVTVPGKGTASAQFNDYGWYTVEGFEEYESDEQLGAVFAPGDNVLLNLVSDGALTGKYSLKTVFNGGGAAVPLFSGRIGVLKGDGMCLNVQASEAMKVLVTISDGSCFVTYTLPVQKSEATQLLHIDWDYFSDARGVFERLNRSNLTLTVSALCENTQEQTLLVDDIGYYVFTDLYSIIDTETDPGDKDPSVPTMPSDKEPNNPKDPSNPPTGDSRWPTMLAVIVLVAIGSMVVVGRKRKEKHT